MKLVAVFLIGIIVLSGCLREDPPFDATAFCIENGHAKGEWKFGDALYSGGNPYGIECFRETIVCIKEKDCKKIYLSEKHYNYTEQLQEKDNE